MRRALLLLVVFLLCAPCLAAAAAEEDAASLLSRARAAMFAGDTATALSIYAQLLEAYPDNADLRLEAARAHLAAGNEDTALYLGRQVLAEYEKKRFQYGGSVQFGFLYDSNANQGPASDQIHLGGWDVRVPTSKRKGSYGAYVGANLDLSNRFSVTSPWYWVGGAQGMWRGYGESSLSENTSRYWQWGRVTTGLRRMDGRNMLDMRVKGEVFNYEFESSTTSWGVELLYARAVTPRFHLLTEAGFERRSYGENGDRDGNFFNVGGYGRFFFGEAGHELLLGGGFMTAGAERDSYKYDGWQITARFRFKLPRGFTLSPQLSYSECSYGGPATILETSDRKDQRLRVGAALSYAVNEAWTVEAGYHYVDNKSNSSLYDYDQHVVSLGTVWRF